MSNLRELFKLQYNKFDTLLHRRLNRPNSKGFQRIITSNISLCMWPIIGLPPAVKIRGGTFEGPGPKR